MRYREARAGNSTEAPLEGPKRGGRDESRYDTRIDGRRARALAAATVSTGVGFLSNVVSPLGAVRDFAILSAGGILATFVAFAVFVPALKVEIDEFLETRFDRDRAKRPFGTGAGATNRVLSRLVAIPQRMPVVVVLVALVLAAGGAYGATGIDTEFNQADFLPEDAPDWAKSLRDRWRPVRTRSARTSPTSVRTSRERGEGSQTQILIREDVTDPDALVAMDEAGSAVDEDGTVVVGSDGEAAIEGPPTLIRELASENETVAAALEERDTNGDGLPDEDVAGLYDVLFDVDADRASDVLYRTDTGAYESARLLVTVQGDAPAQTVADDSRDVAAAVENAGPVTAVATGGPVTTAVVQDALLETLVQAFAITLVVILVFLTGPLLVPPRGALTGRRNARSRPSSPPRGSSSVRWRCSTSRSTARRPSSRASPSVWASTTAFTSASGSSRSGTSGNRSRMPSPRRSRVPAARCWGARRRPRRALASSRWRSRRRSSGSGW